MPQIKQCTDSHDYIDRIMIKGKKAVKVEFKLQNETQVILTTYADSNGNEHIVKILFHEEIE